MHNSLNRLSDLAGIQAGYRDIWDNPHAVTADTRRALLAAMGYACGEKKEIERTLATEEERPWRALLGPVQVAFQGEPVPVPLHLPVDELEQAIHWRLELEGGGGAEATVELARLPQTALRSVAGREHVELVLTLPAQETAGYHQLVLDRNGAEQARMPLIVCPGTCYRPDAVREGRVWGVSVQLYGVRSQRNWGMGDFTDLKSLMEWAADKGAGVVGVNPMHALYPHNPQHISPYSPSSRNFLNVLYIDVEAVPEFSECESARARVADPEFQARLRALRGAPLLDYPGVAAAKFPVLAMLYQHFRERHLTPQTPRGRSFLDFVREGGEALERLARYEALQARFYAGDDAVWGWPAWPESYHEADSPEVSAWVEEHRETVEYYQYLQWLATTQLEAVGLRSYELGLGVGLYQDLAVGVDRGGAETWSHPHLYAFDASVGAPPDDFNLHGQDWGLPPWIPPRLRDEGYAPFAEMLRANMRQAGALRIDHVMSLMRLFMIPRGGRGEDGTYVGYPFRDLLGILALESQRNQCLVIGEDLGTVPDEVRSAMLEFGILSYRLFYFQKAEDGGFLPPADYPGDALVGATTHDLPTLAGFWRGLDLDLRTSLNLYPTEVQREAQIVGRAEERARLLVALEREGLLPEGMGVHPVNVPEMTPPLATAVHRYLARSPARMLAVQAEDMLGEVEQANLPGTLNEHPNWRRKLSLNLEEWSAEGRINGFCEALQAERGSSVRPRPAVPAEVCIRVMAPRATYRLQLNKDFTFRDATALVPYLAALGISHVYCSPYLAARPGSPHGYDIVDHNALNSEIGTREDFETFCAVLAEHGMGQVLDMVPNHMGVMGADNGWWLDVLENGPASHYAGYFDIDWQPIKDELQGKVLVPVLGDHYGAVLERGELRLDFSADTGEFSVWYWQHRFPVDPGEYPGILSHRLEELGQRLGPEHPDFIEYQSLATGFSHLPGREATAPEAVVERARDKEVHKRHLASLAQRSVDIQQFLRENVDLFNGRSGEPASFELLDALLTAQAYRLAYWRVAADEINYRRFFDINDLAALRMEREEVFVATHHLVGDLFGRGLLAGLRIDHSDGLYAPAAYFSRLHQLYREARPAAPDAPWIVVEKILAPHERMPQQWQVCGTTGYDFANLVNGVFVDTEAAAKMEKAWRGFSGERRDFDEILYQAKRTIMKTSLASELNVLANRLSRISEMERDTRDYTLISLRGALMEVAACFPVYRTYIDGGEVREEDRRHIEWACAVAKKRTRAADVSVFDFVRDVLLTRAAEGKKETYRRVVVDFAMAFQQFTSPVTAKGMEDTAFYRYYCLASLNEVGGEPRRFGVTPAAFHHANQERARQTPNAMLTTSTHDSKRSEDVRTRIDVLSELPEEWRTRVLRWHRLNRSRLGYIEGLPAPGRADEYLFYQTLIGTWPVGAPETQGFGEYVERIKAYLLKAVREAKESSSWLHPDPAYEEGVMRFVDQVLQPGSRFVQDFASFAERIARFGRLSSLAQVLLKLTCPGVPDVYRGMEFWTDSLVDPDNRRPVDFAARAAALETVRAGVDVAELGRRLSADPNDDSVKLFLTWRTLELRREREALFRGGDYLPLSVSGRHARHALAYARSDGASMAAVIVPRLAYGLLDGGDALPLGEAVWADTAVALPQPGTWRNAYTGEILEVPGDGAELPLARALAAFPVALLSLDG